MAFLDTLHILAFSGSNPSNICQRKVHLHQLDSAFYQLCSMMVEAASEAGCSTSSGARISKSYKCKPYFDRECQELRKRFKWAMRHDVDIVWILAWAFFFFLQSFAASVGTAG